MAIIHYQTSSTSSKKESKPKKKSEVKKKSVVNKKSAPKVSETKVVTKKESKKKV